MKKITQRFAALSTLLSVALLTPGAAHAEPAPARVDIPAHTINFHCTNPTPDADSRGTILLVHGVGFNAANSYQWTLQNRLLSENYDTCFVDLPQDGRGNLVEAGEHVALAIMKAAERTSDRITVVGHSAGPATILWALRFFPQVADRVKFLISLAGAIHGTALIEPVCPLEGGCPDIAWQFFRNSNFMKALHREPIPSHISVTSIFSLTDYGIQPAKEVSSYVFPGKFRNIAVQQVCPTLVGHLGVLQNAASQMLLMDALDHNGLGSVERVKKWHPLACSEWFADSVDMGAMPSHMVGGMSAYVKAFTDPRVEKEPPLPAYAR